MDLGVVQKYMGHASPITTMLYRQVVAKDLQQAVEVMQAFEVARSRA